MAGDTAGGLVTFGGMLDACCAKGMNDTWKFDGTWTAWSGRSSPSVRWSHAMAGAASRVLLHGGQFEKTGKWSTLSDTWVWDQQTWRLADSRLRSPERAGHALAWLGPWGKFLLFGGAGPIGDALADTWAFDAESDTWNRVATPEAPPARWRHRMVYDSGVKRVLLFGGERKAGEPLNDSWVAAPGP
jgi:hypothetical protein